MKTYNVYVQSVQTWTYVYQVDAESIEQAEELGLSKHHKGVESNDNWVDFEDCNVFQTIEGSL
jgi:hypothetical protein